jgi:hypothetical protein
MAIKNRPNTSAYEKYQGSETYQVIKKIRSSN